jgi:hypothetical protein
MNFNRTIKILLACVLTLSLSAQKKKATKPGGPTQAEITASKVIEYTNAVIDLNNRQTKKLKEYDRVIEYGEKHYERYNRSYDPKFPVSFTQTKYPVPAGYIAQYEEAEKKAPTFPEKNDIIGLVKKARHSVAKLDEWSDKMGSYYKGAEFAKDDFAGYAPIRDSVEYYLKESKNNWRAAVRRASDVGSASENILLKKSKLAAFVIPMKADLNLMKNLVNDLYTYVDDEEESGDIDLAYLKTKMDEMNASLSKNKDVTGKNVAVLHNVADYEYFYSKGEEVTKYFSRILEGLSATDMDTDKLNSNFTMLNQEYNQLIEIYNYFVSRGAK